MALSMALISGPPLLAAPTALDGCQILGQGCGAAKSLPDPRIALSWGDVIQVLFGTQKKSKGRRTEEDSTRFSCMVVPGIMEDPNDPLKGTANTVMTRRPLFLWQGEVTQIDLYDADNPINQPIWTQAIEPGQQHIFYDGKVPLVPNSLGYYWQLTLRYPPESNPDETPRKAFMILDEETTTAIQKQFDPIDLQPLTEAEKALKRVEILSKQAYGPTKDEALGADILAEIYQLGERPPALASLNEFDFCEPEASVS
ncbi:hypothetical protein HRE53_30275 (plasmid) [Acaryochloris sp. 'Moss Beach']|uniref:hypothetical protein n=1 Tax=Acaryochloris sp. 'Moss Beach' TaxID=2740837 RepID=UPI001F474930|nr:hypothetical protein [Acaryochloris sp. 'Moss Beach']UJB73019.1 hypothetical protein HRE53_30275 [Acaryochloris sp. 'Moss Beach']